MFPNYKKRGWWIFKWNVPDGWKDLGDTGYSLYVSEAGKTGGNMIFCLFCHDKLKVGREKNEIFLFCPRCFEKLTRYI